MLPSTVTATLLLSKDFGIVAPETFSAVVLISVGDVDVVSCSVVVSLVSRSIVVEQESLVVVVVVEVVVVASSVAGEGELVPPTQLFVDEQHSWHGEGKKSF